MGAAAQPWCGWVVPIVTVGIMSVQCPSNLHSHPHPGSPAARNPHHSSSRWRQKAHLELNGGISAPSCRAEGPLGSSCTTEHTHRWGCNDTGHFSLAPPGPFHSRVIPLLPPPSPSPWSLGLPWSLGWSQKASTSLPTTGFYPSLGHTGYNTFPFLL